VRKDLSAPEIRVLGCLLEKQRTTPDGYPLTLNSLRLACNQSTNRDPVVDYDEATVRAAAERLARRRLARFASGHQSRVAKYRHLLREELGLADDELAMLALLLLRGPQTPGELKGRSERLHPFSDVGGVLDSLARLAGRELATSAGRRPGQKEERWMHRLSEEAEEAAPPEAPDAAGPALSAADAPPAADERLDRIERELAELREAVAALRSELGA
jgi:uncharacterized protein YceH (UPF0502 family)